MFPPEQTSNLLETSANLRDNWFHLLEKSQDSLVVGLGDDGVGQVGFRSMRDVVNQRCYGKLECLLRGDKPELHPKRCALDHEPPRTQLVLVTLMERGWEFDVSQS